MSMYPYTYSAILLHMLTQNADRKIFETTRDGARAIITYQHPEESTPQTYEILCRAIEVPK
jgi:hypothetical protein